MRGSFTLFFSLKEDNDCRVLLCFWYAYIGRAGGGGIIFFFGGERQGNEDLCECMCACVRACVRECVRACVHVCVGVRVDWL